MNKKTRITLLAIAGTVLICFATGVAALHLMFPPEKIRAIIVAPVEKALGREVTIEKISIELFPALGLSMKSFRIANTSREGFSRESFVSIDRFTARISLVSIFKGYPEITGIVITHPTVLLEADKNGSFNYDDLALLTQDTAQKQSPRGGLPMLPVPITLRKLALEKGSIVYVDRKNETQVSIGSINQEWRIAVDRSLSDIATTGNLKLADISLKTKEITKPLTNLSATFEHAIAANLVDGTVTINQASVTLQKIAVILTGSIRNALGETPDLDLVLASEPVAIGDLLREIPVELFPAIKDLSAEGSAEIGLAIKGALSKNHPLPLQGRLSLKNVLVKQRDLPMSINNLNASVDFTDSSLVINEMKMRLGNNPISIQGTVRDFAKPYIDATLLADVDLSQIKDILTLPPGSALSGKISADIKALGLADPADPSRLDLRGTVGVKNVSAILPPLLKPAKMNGTITLSSQAVGGTISTSIGRSSLTLTAMLRNFLPLVLPDSTKKVPRPSMDLKCTSPLLDIDEIIGAPPSGKGDPGDENKGPMLAPLPGVDLVTVVTMKKLVYRAVSMNNASVKITMRNDIGDIVFSTGVAGGSLRNTLHADVSNVNDLSFTNNLSVNSIEIHDLLSSFGSYIAPVTPLNRELLKIDDCLFGRVTLQSSLTGHGANADAIMRTLAGKADLRIKNGKLENAPFQKATQNAFVQLLKTDRIGQFSTIRFGDLNASITILNGRAMFNDLTMRSDLGDWKAQGSVGFDATMDMTASTQLNRGLSDRIVGATEGVVKGVAKEFLSGTPLAGAAGLVDNARLIPRDNQGRIPIKFTLRGPVSDPKVSSIGFGKGSTPSSSPRQQPKIKQQVAQEKKKVQNEVKKEAEKLKKQGVKKLKGLFNR